MLVVSVPVRTNPPRRPARLLKGIGDYLSHSTATIIRSYTMYRLLRVFFLAGLLLIISGMILVGRFLIFFFVEKDVGIFKSLILSAVLLIVGFQTGLIGLVADPISKNRRILEDILCRNKQLEGEARE